MKWQAKMDQSIVVDDKGLRTLLKHKDDPGAFADALVARFEAAVSQHIEDGIPIMVEFSPMHPDCKKDVKSKKIYGMTGGM